KEHHLTALSASTAARLWEKAGRLEKAQLRNEQSQAACQASCGVWHPATAAIMQDLGRVALKQADYARASALFGQCLAIRKKVLGETHPQTAEFLRYLDFQPDVLVFQARQAEQKDDFPAARKLRDGVVQLQIG